MHVAPLAKSQYGRRCKQIGAANAVDMVLTVPIFVATMLVVVQLALICHAALVVQYAAYAAARTARVSIWDADLAFRDLQCTNDRKCLAVRYASLGTTAARFTADLTNLQNLTDSIGAGKIGSQDAVVTAAAMMRLVAISPADTRLHGSPTGNQQIWNQAAFDEYATYVTEQHYPGQSGQADRRQRVISSKARYAFDERNTTVTWTILSLEPLQDIAESAQGGGFLDIAQSVVAAGLQLNDYLSVAPYFANNALRLPSLPIEVEVTYRFPLQVPFAKSLFNTDEARPYARTMIFKVRLT